MTRMRFSRWGALALAALLTVGCGGEDGEEAPVTGDAGAEPTASPSPGEPTAAGDTTSGSEADTAEPGATGEPGASGEPEAVEPEATEPAPALPSAEEVQLNGECPMDVDFGGFVIAAAEFAFVDGAVSTAVLPYTILEEVYTDGSCRLLKRDNPVCLPPCSAGDTCDHDGSCIPFPTPVSLGTVTVEGLKEEAAIEPASLGNSYSLTTLPNPPFEPGDVLRLTTSGGEFPPQTLHGVGVEPLELGLELWDVSEGAGLDISWTPPSQEGVRSHVWATVNIDQHGNSPLIVVCEFEDTGSATISSEALDMLLSSGISGFPNGLLVRRTADSVTVGESGCMDLIVSSPQTPDVRVDGHTPCNTDAECPSGQTCDVAVQTCT